MQICKGWKEMSWKTEEVKEAQNQIGHCTIAFFFFFHYSTALCNVAGGICMPGIYFVIRKAVFATPSVENCSTVRYIFHPPTANSGDDSN